MISKNVILFGISIPETLVISWGILIIMIIFGSITLQSLWRSTPEHPRPLAAFGILAVRSLEQWVESAMGRENIWYAPFIGGLAVFLWPANLVGLIGLTPPAADIRVPAALVTVVFGYMHFHGFRKRKWAYFRRYTQPVAFVLPLNLISDISTPLSMAMRLFGNMVGGSFIMSLLYQVMPVGIPVLPHLFFDVFAGTIQVFIFAMLAMTFTASALE